MDSIKDLINKKKRQRGLKKPLEIYELFGQWNEHAQAAFGNKQIRMHPKFIKNKTLYVQVEGASLASELQLRSYQLMKKINDHFEKKMIERIVFKL